MSKQNLDEMFKHFDDESSEESSSSSKEQPPRPFSPTPNLPPKQSNIVQQIEQQRGRALRSFGSEQLEDLERIEREKRNGTHLIVRDPELKRAGAIVGFGSEELDYTNTPSQTSPSLGFETLTRWGRELGNSLDRLFYGDE